MTKIDVILGVALFAATLGAWSALNRPADEPPWPAALEGLAYSPLRGGPPRRASE